MIFQHDSWERLERELMQLRAKTAEDVIRGQIANMEAYKAKTSRISTIEEVLALMAKIAGTAESPEDERKNRYAGRD